MKPISVRQIAEAVEGTIAWGDKEAWVNHVVTDSRKAGKGSLFVPICGERVDAHRFIPDVLEQGASLVFSSDHSICENGGSCIYVDDTLEALQKLAAWYRKQFAIPVIGITGSVGKTTTKEMIAAVLEKKYRIVRTIGNLNSQIGVALMMFELEEDTELAVFEMGISMPGEMERLVEMASPTTAVLTNVGVSHIGNLHSRENICYEKGKIIGKLPSNGVFYVCGDGDLRKMAEETLNKEDKANRMLFYGTGRDNDFYADSIKIKSGGQSFRFHHGRDSYEVHLAVMGEHNIKNAVAAMALAEQFHVPKEEAAEALRQYRPIAMRGVIREKSGIHIIDDTYNASPDSIKSNLHALFDYPGGKKTAVLADVLELGDQSKELHEEIASFIISEAGKGRKLSFLVTVGKETAAIYNKICQNSDIPAIHCEKNEEAVAAVRESMQTGDWILVKGSRGMHMDEVVDQLMKE